MPSYSARHIQSQRKVFEYPSSERDLDMRIEAFYMDSNHSMLSETTYSKEGRVLPVSSMQLRTFLPSLGNDNAYSKGEKMAD